MSSDVLVTYLPGRSRSRMEALLQMFVQFFATHFAIAKDFRK